MFGFTYVKFSAVVDGGTVKFSGWLRHKQVAPLFDAWLQLAIKQPDPPMEFRPLSREPGKKD